MHNRLLNAAHMTIKKVKNVKGQRSKVKDSECMANWVMTFSHDLSNLVMRKVTSSSRMHVKLDHSDYFVMKKAQR